jgi:aminoglycoside phosphotransferase (APT) family kinase protein
MIVTLKPALTVTDAQAQAIVDRAAPGRKVERIGELLAGEISAVFAIELADGSPAFVLKVYPETMHWKMQKEVSIARLLAALPIPVPRILLADESRSLLDLNFIVMSHSDGRNVSQWEPSLDQRETHEIYRQIGAALRIIHSVTLESFGYLVENGVAQPFASNRAYMLSQFERKLGGFAKLGGRPALTEQLDAYLKRGTDLLDGCTRPVLCHYDYHSGNLLADRRNGTLQLTGIIDLENAIAGDPLMDLAKTIAYSVRDDITKRAGLLAGYGPIDRSDWQETLRLYQFYGAIELWAWWTQIGDHQRADNIVADLEKYASIS